MNIINGKKTQKTKIEEQIKELKKELEMARKLSDEFKNKYLRALADYQNYEKRTKEEKEELIKSANADLVLRLLPVLDSLDKAEVFVKDPGLQIVKDSFNKVLDEAGVKEIPILNKEFDPSVAEAVGIVEGKKDNIVVEVLRKGYEYNGKVLRVAQVKVSRKL